MAATRPRCPLRRGHVRVSVTPHYTPNHGGWLTPPRSRPVCGRANVMVATAWISSRRCVIARVRGPRADRTRRKSSGVSRRRRHGEFFVTNGKALCRGV